MSAMDEIEAAVDSVAAKRDDVDAAVVEIKDPDEWRRALTLIHATAKEWYSLRNRMMDAYLKEMRRKDGDT
jgi:hypothetical protein